MCGCQKKAYKKIDFFTIMSYDCVRLGEINLTSTRHLKQCRGGGVLPILPKKKNQPNLPRDYEMYNLPMRVKKMDLKLVE